MIVRRATLTICKGDLILLPQFKTVFLTRQHKIAILAAAISRGGCRRLAQNQ